MPGPTAIIVASRILDCAFSGIKIPPLLVVRASARCTRTRSKSGSRRFAIAAYENNQDGRLGTEYNNA